MRGGDAELEGAGTELGGPAPGVPGPPAMTGLGTDLGAPAAPAGMTGLGTELGGPSSGGMTGFGTDVGAPSAAAATPPDRSASTSSGTPAPRGRTRIGLYEVMEELGRGGMGAVYRAWHPMRRRWIALKVINPDVADGAKFEKLRELFLREGGILMSVQHENVVGCYDANEAIHDGKPVLYMALELLEGESLSQRLGRGPLAPLEAIRIARAIARALEKLHTHPQRILHRDLKPANVFLTSDGGIKLLDFGLAAVADWRLTQVSMFAAGSRPFMSPEQFDGLRFCTERSDLYSLGVTIFQMIAGRCPFEADTDQGFLEAHKRKSPPPIVAVHPGAAKGPVLDALQNIVTRLLAKKQAERYASAADLIEALDVAEHGGKIAKPKVTRPEIQRLKRILAGTVAAAALVAGAIWGALYLQRSGVPAELERIRALRNELRLSEARDDVTKLLTANPGHADAQKLAEEIADLVTRQENLRRRREGADRDRKAGRLEPWAEELAKIAADARGLFPADEVERLAAAAADAKAEWERAEEAARDAAAAAARRDRELSERAALISEDLRQAEALLTADPGKALEYARKGREALATAGPEVEKRAGKTAGEAADLETAARSRANAFIHADAIGRAERALGPGGDAAAAEAAGREALRALPVPEGAAFRDMARAFAADRAARGEIAARAALRERLRGAPAAERAWLLVERASAERSRRPEERLVRRLEGITLGSEDADRGNPIHVVTLAPFYIDAIEVTAEDYARYVAAKGRPAPEGWKESKPPAGREKHPVRGILFAEARDYAAHVGKRLPSADEWEAAASVDPDRPAGARRLHPWGDPWLDGIAPSGASEPRVTGALERDRSPWGCYDMGGNVQEWTVEWGADGRERPILQGGSFQLARFQKLFRAAQRSPFDVSSGIRLEDGGVRCARDVPAPDLSEFEGER